MLIRLVRIIKLYKYIT
jgi:hypothetical protein